MMKPKYTYMFSFKTFFSNPNDSIYLTFKYYYITKLRFFIKKLYSYSITREL